MFNRQHPIINNHDIFIWLINYVLTVNNAKLSITFEFSKINETP